MIELAMAKVDAAVWELACLWFIVWTWHGGILLFLAVKQAAKFEPSYRPVVLLLFGPIGWLLFSLVALKELLITRNWR